MNSTKKRKYKTDNYPKLSKKIANYIVDHSQGEFGHDDRCFIWYGPLDDKGYPIFYHNKKKIYLRKFMYRHFVKPLKSHTNGYINNSKESKLVMMCNNKICINHKHMQEKKSNKVKHVAKKRKLI